MMLTTALLRQKRAEKTHFQRRKPSHTRRERSWAWRRIPFSNSESHARPETPSHPGPSLLPFISAPHCSRWHCPPFRLPLGFTEGKCSRREETLPLPTLCIPGASGLIQVLLSPRHHSVPQPQMNHILLPRAKENCPNALSSPREKGQNGCCIPRTHFFKWLLL